VSVHANGASAAGPGAASSEQPELLLGFAGPTLFNCLLPFFFVGDWIYLDWYALHAATCNFQQDRPGNASSARFAQAVVDRLRARIDDRGRMAG
jgi:hypothetical protein